MEKIKNQKNHTFKENPIGYLSETFKKQIPGLIESQRAENIIKIISSSTEGMIYKKNTIREFFSRNKYITEDLFLKIFFGDNKYNKIILFLNADIIKIFDNIKIDSKSDLIEVLIEKIGIEKDDFLENTNGKIPDFLTFPQCSSYDIAQNNFHKKLQELLKNTNIIMGDNPEIKNNIGLNEIKINTIGFWGYGENQNNYLNLCTLKIIKTESSLDKINELDVVFNNYEKIFIGGSINGIPLNTKKLGYKNIILSRESNHHGKLELKGDELINCMGYLNSSYYHKNTKAAFVGEDHNIFEPLHAGVLTINNFPQNRYNHNWLASYIGEKFGLLLILNPKDKFEENQKKLEDFLNISDKEIDKRKKMFNEYIETKAIKFVYKTLEDYFQKRFS